MWRHFTLCITRRVTGSTWCRPFQVSWVRLLWTRLKRSEEEDEMRTRVRLCDVCHHFHLRLQRSRVRISTVPLSGNNLGQVVHTHVPLLPSSIIWYRSRSISPAAGKVTVLPMRHKLQRFIHLRAHGLRKKGEHSSLLYLFTGINHKINTFYTNRVTCVRLIVN